MTLTEGKFASCGHFLDLKNVTLMRLPSLSCMCVLTNWSVTSLRLKTVQRFRERVCSQSGSRESERKQSFRKSPEAVIPTDRNTSTTWISCSIENN